MKYQSIFEIACDWYDETSVWTEVKGRIADGKVPKDAASREFSEWLTDKYRLAMMKGILIGREQVCPETKKAKEIADRNGTHFEGHDPLEGGDERLNNGEEEDHGRAFG